MYAFSQLCESIAATTKKLEKIQLVADYFRSLHDDLDNAALGALYLCGRVFPRREERVLMCLLDSIDWPTVFLGTLYAGRVAVPVNTLMTEDDYRYMLEDSRARVQSPQNGCDTEEMKPTPPAPSA